MPSKYNGPMGSTQYKLNDLKKKSEYYKYICTSNRGLVVFHTLVFMGFTTKKFGGRK
jgi:hypothetical protein